MTAITTKYRNPQMQRAFDGVLAAPQAQPERKPMHEGEIQAAWLGQDLDEPIPYSFVLGIRSADYPECWDTAAYPELRDAIHEALAWSGCSVCKPATAPAWHVAPTVPGLWVSDFSWMAQKLDRETVEFYAKNRSIPSRRWYGPMPEDKP